TVRIGRLRLTSTAASESRTVTIRLGCPRTPPSPLIRPAGRRLVTASGSEPAGGFARWWQTGQAYPSWTAVDACSWSLRGTATGSAHPPGTYSWWPAGETPCRDRRRCRRMRSDQRSGLAAIDVYAGPEHQARGVRGEERDDPSHFLGGAETAERHVRF